MYIITYKGKPITCGRLYELEGKTRSDLELVERDLYMAGRTQIGLKAIYVYHFGWGWQDRKPGIDIQPMQ